MSIFNEFHVSHNHERKLKQISGESELHYAMIRDYLIFRNIPELVYKYKINSKEIYELSIKYNWTDRVAKYDIACDKAYMKEIFTDILAYNQKKRENLINLTKSIQDQIHNFQDYILVDPKYLLQRGKPSQEEIIHIVRQSTRAMLDLQKLAKIINEELKAIGIDLSPAAQKKFELEEILGDSLLDQAEDTEEIIRSVAIQSGADLRQFKEAKANNTPNQDSVIEPVEMPETLATEPNPLTKVQDFINQTKNQLKELGVDSVTELTSSVVERVETHDEANDENEDYYDDDDEEYYDELAPENYRYPFPVEYLIPVNER